LGESPHVAAVNLPLDGESSHSGLLCQHVTLYTLDDGLGRGLSVELLGVILVVDIVTNANEFTSIVGAGQKNDGDTKDFGIRNAGGFGSIGLENEFVYSDGDGTDEEGVEFLVILITRRC
jgi:hypothetical protein